MRADHRPGHVPLGSDPLIDSMGGPLQGARDLIIFAARQKIQQRNLREAVRSFAHMG